jgi:uncharacterized protein YsxB (DUF464 family)
LITITVTENSITAKGHANYDTHGKDIVCAAVSTLMQTLELVGNATKQSGNMKVYTEDKQAHKLVTDGLKLIADNYPNHVEIKEGE